MAKKITINLWVDKATNNANYSIMIDNINQFLSYLNKYGLNNIGESDYDLDIIDTEAYFGE